jgi:hypothetical protein
MQVVPPLLMSGRRAARSIVAFKFSQDVFRWGK